MWHLKTLQFNLRTELQLCPGECVSIHHYRQQPSLLYSAQCGVSETMFYLGVSASWHLYTILCLEKVVLGFF